MTSLLHSEFVKSLQPMPLEQLIALATELLRGTLRKHEFDGHARARNYDLALICRDELKQRGRADDWTKVRRAATEE